MSRLIWDAVGEKFYEMGTKIGVLYPMNNTGAYDKGVAWNGLTAVTESPSGAEETKLYADDIKYASLRSAEEYGYTIEAYTTPPSGSPATVPHRLQRVFPSVSRSARALVSAG